eukprot:631298-Prymnesium_polylepis.1
MSYFCFLVAALSPCHGRLPRRKYLRPRTRERREASASTGAARGDGSNAWRLLHQHVAERLEVVSPALLDAQVRVDRCVPRSARE